MDEKKKKKDGKKLYIKKREIICHNIFITVGTKGMLCNVLDMLGNVLGRPRHALQRPRRPTSKESSPTFCFISFEVKEFRTLQSMPRSAKDVAKHV